MKVSQFRFSQSDSLVLFPPSLLRGIFTRLLPSPRTRLLGSSHRLAVGLGPDGGQENSSTRHADETEAPRCLGRQQDARWPAEVEDGVPVDAMARVCTI